MSVSPLLTTQEAGAYMRRSRSWLSRHADEIGCVRDGGRLLFKRANLDAWIERHSVGGERLQIVAPRRAQKSIASRMTGINSITGQPYGSIQAVPS